MGRPEKPVDHSVPALGALAEHLRAMRRDAGLTYRQLAERTHYSAAQLKRAASGVSLPSYKLVLAYAEGCCIHGDRKMERAAARATSLQEEAFRAVRRSRIEARATTVLPQPKYVRDHADLSGAMRDAWSHAGRLPSREIEARSRGQLPHSTAHAICKGRCIPRDFRQFVTFLHACEIKGTALEPWFRAWFKVYGRPNERTVAAALQFLRHTDERRIYLDLYANGAETPERSREELGLVAETIKQLRDYGVASTMRSHKRADAVTLRLPTGTGKTESLLAPTTVAADGTLTPRRDPSLKPPRQAAAHRASRDPWVHIRTLVGMRAPKQAPRKIMLGR
ncbi:helix-turn-helix domain-containing protein [Streptomyces longwoodensis]|uniref:helix-turn-helix domain-containing protein n=1 Tax=Streptomyces longwoodensis TaxID=68231 RepID=UPI0034038462